MGGAARSAVNTRVVSPELLARWGLAAALQNHPGLSVVPGSAVEVRLAGELEVHHDGPTGTRIDALYQVEIRVPIGFPRILPMVYETGGQIEPEFHHLRGGALCLGSLIGQRVQLRGKVTLGQFIDNVVIPYLYGHAHWQRVGSMPFGELAHGAKGLEDDVRHLLHLPAAIPVEPLLRLAALRRRLANKRRCPCGGGRRLGMCHHALTNRARINLGRRSCLEQALHIEQQRALEQRVNQTAAAE